MERKALYAGSFDPLTKGHVDMIERASGMYDQVYVAIGTNISKNSLFTAEEKLDLTKQSLVHMENVMVMLLEEGLTVDLARRLGVTAMIRGLRNTTDFEYEMNIALMNKLQAPDIETVLLLSDERYRFVSSSIIKEVAQFGGDVSALVPDLVNQAIQEKYKQKEK
ncbi:phosphopantetheine adenylyltransferase [Aerococcus urinaehominis]|uniref:Phosphopantetheine adenylyltransferase n=1 Tax=Aerococcus urinaehominis TaxID=128944 RepID=A0A0X8FMM4_9LACT|nr:phosphopantetheine adenylyltransferase [Aerococcus urinaehominis]